MPAYAVGPLRLAGDVDGLCRVVADEDLASAACAIHLLADLDGAGATDVVLRVLEDPEGFQHHGADSLSFAAIQVAGRLRVRRAVPVLMDLVTQDLGYRSDAACEALSAIGDPRAIPALLASAANREFFGSKPAAGAAIKALARFEPEVAVPLLLAQLWDFARDHRALVAVRELGRIGSPAALPALAHLVRHDDHAVRRAAARALTRLTDVSDVDYRLGTALGDPDPWTARAVAEALARSGPGRGLLQDNLRYGDPLVRENSCHGLAASGDRRFVPALGEVLRTDESAMVRRAAATALHDFGDASALLLPALGDAPVRDIVVDGLTASVLPDLVAILEDGDPLRRHDAARALGRMGDERAGAPLLAILPETADRVRAAVAEALGALRHAPALPALVAIAEDPDETGAVRAQAVFAAGACGDRDLPLQALRDPNEAVRVRAAEILGDFPGAEVATALGRAIGEDTRDVQRAALESLGKHGAGAEHVLFEVLDRVGDDLRGHAASLLPRCATASAIPRLTSLVFGKDHAISLAAVRTLAGLDDPMVIDSLIAVVSRTLPNPSWGKSDQRHVIATQALARFDDERAVTAIAEKSLLVCQGEAREVLTTIAEWRARDAPSG
ncbi:HEAT repeat domain-containing protein [Amycolatopsis sp. NPDC058340]|uniref:HEAT repeat domain-containing protein n=1 Tax=Amycolatopsis sp. NPDC058340 TaxID=3346453 RepID=UPI00366340C2